MSTFLNKSRPFDKVELAKSGRSSCRICKKKIAEGTKRMGIHYLSHRGNQWYCGYYHINCIKNTKEGKKLLSKARFEPSSPGKSGKRKGEEVLSNLELLEMGTATAEKKQKASKNTLEARADLRETLRKIRMRIARHYDQPAYFVFTDKTLNALVEELPCKSIELLKVHGFGPVKTNSLGRFLLPTIRAYKRKLSCGDTTDKKSTSDSKLPASPVCVTKLKSQCGDNDDEDFVIFESEISIDEMIDKKVKEAEERGEMIVLDM